MYMLDTDICSYVIKEQPPTVAEKFRAFAKDELRVSSITYAEMMYGVKKIGSGKLLAKLQAFFALVTLVDFDIAAADIYAELRVSQEKTGEIVDNMDLLIAACALAHHCVLITNNQRHYTKISRLKIENWR